MVRRKIRIEKKMGAELIPYLVQSACHYSSSLYIEAAEKNINMKSIMGMSILDLREGNIFELVAEGDDEQRAAREIADCFA